jgi:hypothetical protein
LYISLKPLSKSNGNNSCHSINIKSLKPVSPHILIYSTVALSVTRQCPPNILIYSTVAHSLTRQHPPNILIYSTVAHSLTRQHPPNILIYSTVPPLLQGNTHQIFWYTGNRFKKSICLFLNSIVQLLLFCLYMLVIPIKYVYINTVL